MTGGSDGAAESVAVGVLADEARVEHVGRLGRERGHSAGGTDGCSIDLGVIPVAHDERAGSSAVM